MVVGEVDEEDAVGVVGVFGGVGEEEAHAAGTGHFGDAGDAVEGADPVGELGNARVGGLDGGAFGHPEVDHHLGARGVGEEVLLDVLEAEGGGDEHREHEGQEGAAVADAAFEEGAVDAVEGTGVGAGRRASVQSD